MANSAQVDTDRKDERKRKRGAIIKLSLAGAALLGIAAAATSAAWTDQAWFSASATGATFELQGKNFATTPAYVDADDETATIVVPAAQLVNLVPGSSRSFELSIKNSGSVGMTVAEAHSWATSSTPFAAAPTVTVTGVPAGTLASGADATITVVVSTPTGWADTNQGKTQDLVLTFTGTSVTA